MSSNGEGVGRLTAEDIAAMRGEETESPMEYLRRKFAESEARIDEADRAAEKASMLGRAAVIASAFSGGDYASIAKHTFDVLAALDAEYERRYGTSR